MNHTLSFLIKRDVRDNKTFVFAPILFFVLLQALNYLWKNGVLASELLVKGLQLSIFAFIFISATLYGVYLNYVLGTSLNVKTQLSLNRNYLFSLPVSRKSLFWMNQLRLCLPLIPFVVLGSYFTLNFEPVTLELTFPGLLLVGSTFSVLLFNLMIWVSDIIEKGFIQRNFSISITRFFVVNPLLIVFFYFAFFRNIPEILAGSYLLILPALLTPVLMIALNYRNWLKRL